MQTRLSPEYANTEEGREAEAILRQCVHCGFCTATCPTYQLLGDELDGPRGRIYLIKQVLEGETPTRDTQRHLDRCLTCRNCETTCPSGVRYGRLVDIGREVVERKVQRPPAEARERRWLRQGLSSPLFGPAMRLGQSVRGFLPAKLQAKVPQRRNPGVWPQRQHARKVLLLDGCVQPSMAPNINSATATFSKSGKDLIVKYGAGSDQVTVKQFYEASVQAGRKQFQFADKTITAAQVPALLQQAQALKAAVASLSSKESAIVVPANTVSNTVNLAAAV